MNEGLTVNDSLGRMWKEAVADCMKILSKICLKGVMVCGDRNTFVIQVKFNSPEFPSWSHGPKAKFF